MPGLIIILLIAWIGGIRHMSEKTPGNTFNHVIFPITFVLRGFATIVEFLIGLVNMTKRENIL